METIKIYNVFNNTSTATTINNFSTKQLYFVLFIFCFFLKASKLYKEFF